MLRNLFLLFCLLVLPILASAENRGKTTFSKLMVNDTEFVIKQIENEDEFSGANIELYRNNRKLLTHTLLYSSGDCNSETVELGVYKVIDNTIVFYSYWALSGDAPVSPYGVRKQVYEVDENGRLALSYSRIYLEATRAGWGQDDYEGVSYMYEEPSDDREREMLSKYKKAVERDYNARFVRNGSEKQQLFDEVRLVLKKEIDKATSGWESRENGFGYKK